MFGKGIYFYLFYCLCYVKDISTDMLEEQVSEDRYPELNEMENIRMEDIKGEHWMDFAEDGEDKSNIHALRWDVYTRDKEELIKREFLVSVLHKKGGNIVWNF